MEEHLNRVESLLLQVELELYETKTAKITSYPRTHTPTLEGKESGGSSTLSTTAYSKRRRRRRNPFQLSDDRMVTAKKNLVISQQKNSDKAFEFTPTRYLLCSITPRSTITMFSLIR